MQKIYASVADNFKKHIRRVILDRGKGVSKQRFAVYARDNEKRGAVRAARQMISLQLRNERIKYMSDKLIPFGNDGILKQPGDKLSAEKTSSGLEVLKINTCKSCPTNDFITT